MVHSICKLKYNDLYYQGIYWNSPHKKRNCQYFKPSINKEILKLKLFHITFLFNFPEKYKHIWSRIKRHYTDWLKWFVNCLNQNKWVIVLTPKTKIVICWFSAKHAASRRKNADLVGSIGITCPSEVKCQLLDYVSIS